MGCDDQFDCSTVLCALGDSRNCEIGILLNYGNSPNCVFGIWRNSPNCEFGILRNCGLESCGLRTMVTAVSPSWRRLPAGQRAGSSPWRHKSVIVPLRINKSTTGFYFAFALLCLEADLVRTRHLTLTRMMAASLL